MNIKPEQKRSGFDAAIKTREEDHLNRWPLAQEIYGIATTGPADWSVRIGIYGEWGSGKSSVLHFVAQMAEKDSHTVVLFNPWQYTSKEALWQALVVAVYSKPVFRSMERARWVNVKKKARWLLAHGKFAEEGAEFLNEKAAKAVGVGLDLVKGLFGFSKDDLAALRGKLGDKRVIVLIDDLDRTDAGLVPEILFALKELMDIPQFSFICAFDPEVVGRVLGEYHPGFGDGLKFLEKIIDYPRWIPQASRDGLVRLAIQDAGKYCPFVPVAAIRNAVELLPANPRAIRQFVRLLTFLKPQVHRHYENELSWPIILAADVLKIRYPHLSQIFLADESLAGKLLENTYARISRKAENKESMEVIAEHVNQIAGEEAQELDPEQKKEITAILGRIFSEDNVGFLTGGDAISYQLRIAEAPHAVTWKEYDEFLNCWAASPVAKTLDAWVGKHAAAVNRSRLDVRREILTATVQRYDEALREAETTLTGDDTDSCVKRAQMLLAILECLLFDHGQVSDVTLSLSGDRLESLFQKLMAVLRSLSAVHAPFKGTNEALLLRVVTEWAGDVTPLVKLLNPYGIIPGTPFDGEPAKTLYQKLREALLPSFAKQIIAHFPEEGFVRELDGNENYAMRGLFLDRTGPIWTRFRSETFAMMRKASSNAVIQKNAFDLFRFFVRKLFQRSSTAEADGVRALVSDKEVIGSLWGALIAKPLNPATTYYLDKQVIPVLKNAGADLEMPAWWGGNLKVATEQIEAARDQAGGADESRENS